MVDCCMVWLLIRCLEVVIEVGCGEFMRVIRLVVFLGLVVRFSGMLLSYCMMMCLLLK